MARQVVLPTGVVGTADEAGNIQIDSTAGGYGWYVDESPEDSREYQMTGNYGTTTLDEAKNKLDLLTVMIHEMGHVLGLNDTVDSRSIMSSYITAGTRRLPDVEAIQHILDIQAGLDEEYNARQAIVAGFQGERKLLGVTLIDNFAPQAWKSLQPIYATLQNADFKQSHQAWYVVGQVTTTDSTVTLSESNHSQTSLRQAFSVTADNRFISFTIVDKDIHHAMNQAGDAFEVALLDAHTGQAITQIDGLTRSDSLLNIQADGTERVATGVKKVSNADGTSSYYIDLSDWYKAQTQAGKATDVLLSFDLLGFATVDSYVSLEDIGLSSRIEDRPSKKAPSTNPNTTDSNSTNPSTTTPSTTIPNTTDSNSTNPSTTTPNTTDSNSTNPSTTTPNTTDSNSTNPSTTTPNTTDSNSTNPSTTIPNTTDSNSTNPSTTDSNSTTPSSTTVNVLPPTKTPVKPVINLTSPNHIANQVVNTNFNKDTHINNTSNSNNITNINHVHNTSNGNNTTNISNGNSITNVSNTSNSHNITNVNNVTNTSNINPINPTNPTQDSTTTDLTDGDSWQVINPYPEQVNGVEYYQQGDIIDIAGQNYQLNAINSVSNGQRWLMLHDGLDINQQSKHYQLLGISKTIKTIAGFSYHK